MVGVSCCIEATVCQWISQKTWGCYWSGFPSHYLSVLDFTWLIVNQLKAYCWSMLFQWQLSVLQCFWRNLAACKIWFSCQSLACSWHLKMIHNWLQDYSCECSYMNCAACWYISVNAVHRYLTVSILVILGTRPRNITLSEINSIIKN